MLSIVSIYFLPLYTEEGLWQFILPLLLNGLDNNTVRSTRVLLVLSLAMKLIKRPRCPEYRYWAKSDRSLLPRNSTVIAHKSKDLIGGTKGLVKSIGVSQHTCTLNQPGTGKSLERTQITFAPTRHFSSLLALSSVANCNERLLVEVLGDKAFEGFSAESNLSEAARR